MKQPDPLTYFQDKGLLKKQFKYEGNIKLAYNKQYNKQYKDNYCFRCRS